jgi:hypothetical protein
MSSQVPSNKSFKADAVNGTRNGTTSQLRHYVSCIASVPACSGNGYTRLLFSLREIRNLDSACPV